MQVRLRFFASLREAFGPGEMVTLPEGSTVADLRALLHARSADHAERLSVRRAVRCAVNQTLADEAAPLADRDEVAFFPPVTGG